MKERDYYITCSKYYYLNKPYMNIYILDKSLSAVDISPVNNILTILTKMLDDNDVIAYKLVDNRKHIGMMINHLCSKYIKFNYDLRKDIFKHYYLLNEIEPELNKMPRIHSLYKFV